MTRIPLIAAAFLLATAPAAAQQQSEGYKFLQAVREAKGNDVTQMLDRPGSTIVNTRDIGTGEGALHIVIRRGDTTYLRYLLQKGADANLRDGRGNTPLVLAVQQGHAEMIPILVAARANPNLGNSAGETPLIKATQARSIEMVRLLLAAKANPDQADRLAGQSARDYAANDPRNTAVARLFAETPRQARPAPVAGPRL